MALGSTQSLTETSGRNLRVGGGGGSRRVRLTTLPPSVSRMSRENVGASDISQPYGPSWPVNRDSFTFFPLLPTSCWFLARLIWLWRWRRNVPPKRRFIFNGLYDVISQKTEIFIITAVWTSSPTRKLYSSWDIQEMSSYREVPRFTACSQNLAMDPPCPELLESRPESYGLFR
jgi:hypothetical protein